MTMHYLKTTDDHAQARDAIATDINEMPAHLLIRELAQHAMDHNRRQAELRPNKAQTCPYTGVNFVDTGAEVFLTTTTENGNEKLVVMNTAPGMDETVFTKFATELRWSSRDDKASGGARNFGWGVRTVCLKASPLGVDTYSKCQGTIRHVKMWRDPVTGWATVSMPKIVKRLPKGVTLEGDGTVTVLHGAPGRENTADRPWEGGTRAQMRKAITNRYMTTAGVKVSLTKELQAARNGSKMYGIGEWLHMQEQKFGKAKSALQEKVIRHERDGVTVLIFMAVKMTHGEETSDMPIGAAWMRPFGAISHDGELYSVQTGVGYSNVASSFGLGAVAGTVTSIIIDNRESAIRVRKDRTVLQNIGQVFNGSGKRIAAADSPVRMRQYAELIQEAKALPEAEWLRTLIKNRICKSAMDAGNEARKRMHELAQSLDLMMSGGAVLDENGTPVVDPEGVSGTRIPKGTATKGEQGGGEGAPHQGKPGGAEKGRTTNGNVFNQFYVQKGKTDNVMQPLKWVDAIAGTPLVNWNADFALFKSLREMLAKEHERLDEAVLNVMFDSGMHKALLEVLGPVYVIWRWREKHGDLRDEEAMQKHWDGAANFELGDFGSLQRVVVEHVREMAKVELKVAA